MSAVMLLSGLLGVILNLLVVGGKLNSAESHTQSCKA